MIDAKEINSYNYMRQEFKNINNNETLKNCIIILNNRSLSTDDRLFNILKNF